MRLFLRLRETRKEKRTVERKKKGRIRWREENEDALEGEKERERHVRSGGGEAGRNRRQAEEGTQKQCTKLTA